MQDEKNVIVAVVLAVLVFLLWQYLVVGQPLLHSEPQAPVPAAAHTPRIGQTTMPQPVGEARAPEGSLLHEAASTASRRVAIRTPDLLGSIALRGARLDDLRLTKYQETADPGSPAVALLLPSGKSNPRYAEFGWTARPGQTELLPGPNTVWRQEGSGDLGVD